MHTIGEFNDLRQNQKYNISTNMISVSCTKKSNFEDNKPQ